jgi:multicomponent Na+:H+ antiporter subunit B
MPWSRRRSPTPEIPARFYIPATYRLASNTVKRASHDRLRGSAAIEALIDIFLLSLLVIIALAVIRLRDLFAVVMLFGIYSLVSAGLFVVLDAVDVAFTEAAVGAGVATVFMLATLALTTSREKIPAPHKRVLPLAVVLVTGVALAYGLSDIPRYGDPANPIHHHVAPHYIEDSEEEIGIPNIVTSVLASYRGYDTLGETAVVFTAAIGVLVLVGGARRRRRRRDESP